MRVAAIITLAAAATLGGCAQPRDIAQSNSASACTVCHGFPPERISRTGLAHPSDANCVVCHPATVDANNNLIPGGAHMSGDAGHALPFVDQHTTLALTQIASCKVCHGVDYDGGSAESCTACHEASSGANFAGSDWRTNCTFCHGGGSAGRDASWSGDLARAAPPQTVAGPAVEADQTSANPKVGAHQRHLVAGTYSAPLACDSCHEVPAQTFPASLQHVGGSVAIQFNAMARQGVSSPGYANGTCAVYCHGSTSLLGGGSNPTPAWTSTGGVTCGTCHTLSPTIGGTYGHAFHVGEQDVACDKCHPGYSISGVTVDLTTHVNGAFDAKVSAGTYTRNATIGPNATPTWPSGSCTATCHTSIPPL